MQFRTPNAKELLYNKKDKESGGFHTAKAAQEAAAALHSLFLLNALSGDTVHVSQVASHLGQNERVVTNILYGLQRHGLIFRGKKGRWGILSGTLVEIPPTPVDDHKIDTYQAFEPPARPTAALEPIEFSTPYITTPFGAFPVKYPENELIMGSVTQLEPYTDPAVTALNDKVDQLTKLVERLVDENTIKEAESEMVSLGVQNTRTPWAAKNAHILRVTPDQLRELGELVASRIRWFRKEGAPWQIRRIPSLEHLYTLLGCNLAALD